MTDKISQQYVSHEPTAVAQGDQMHATQRECNLHYSLYESLCKTPTEIKYFKAPFFKQQLTEIMKSISNNHFRLSAYKQTKWQFEKFALLTGGTVKGHFWMDEIGNIIGEFCEVNWGRIRLIAGVTIRGLYCIPVLQLTC